MADTRLDALTTPQVDRVEYDAPHRWVTVNGETITEECAGAMTFDALADWVAFTRLVAGIDYTVRDNGDGTFTHTFTSRDEEKEQ